MQRDFGENEVSFKFSSGNFTIPLFPGIDVDDLLEEEKGSDNNSSSSSSVQVQPTMNSVTGSTTTPDIYSLNFGQNDREGGGLRETNNVQHVSRMNQSFEIPALAAVPVRQSQSGGGGGGLFSRTEVAPILPRMTNYLGSQPFGNHYKMHCFPYNNMHVSSASTPRMKRKIDACTNAFNSTEMDSLFDQIPSGASQDSVVHTSFMPVRAVFQNPFFSIAARGPVNHSLTPFNLEATENQEMDFFATSRGAWNDNSLSSNASVPVHKRKGVRSRFSSGTSVSIVSEGNKNADLKPSAKHGFPLLRECNTLEATPIVRPSWFPTNSELCPGLLSTASSYTPEDDKEIEGKGLVLLLQKELRNTDVGNLGRIVLPKKDAEANLPPLDAKDGVILQMDDMTYSVEWKFKYRYWPNNKSRMYVMENTGDFVKTHNLQTGDHFIVYKELSSGKYIVRGKKEVRTLFVDDMMEQRDEKRPEYRETGVASRQVHSQQANLVPSDGFVEVKAEQDVATGAPFDFVGDSGRLSEFFPLSLQDIDPEGGL